MIAGHSFHDRYRGEGESDLPALEAFLDAGPAPIVFTLGSFFTLDKSEHYRACLDAAGRVGRRAVLLAHESDLAGLREGLPAQAFAAAYVPHSRVFPRACAIVHHGGAGASGQALRAGKPQLVTPLSADQPDNAERLRRLGVARVLSGAVTAAALARELAPLLGEGAYAARAREVAAQVAREDAGGSGGGEDRGIVAARSRARSEPEGSRSNGALDREPPGSRSAGALYLMRKWLRTASRNRKISAAESSVCAMPAKATASGMIGAPRSSP